MAEVATWNFKVNGQKEEVQAGLRFGDYAVSNVDIYIESFQMIFFRTSSMRRKLSEA